MAARPADAGTRLCPMVARDARPRRRPGPGTPGGGVARLHRRARPVGPGRRCAGAQGGRAVHALPARLPRLGAPAVAGPARPLPRTGRAGWGADAAILPAAARAAT